MARMLGIHASGIRGSIGGNTFLANTYHQIVIRQRTAPVQPGTSFQTSVKSGFGGGVAAWEQASEAYREGWVQYAQTVTLQGPLGSYQPSGRNLAIGQYAATQYITDVGGEAPTGGLSMEPPEVAGVLALEGVKSVPLVAAGTGFEINVGQANGETVIAYGVRSLKQSAARYFYKGPWSPATFQAEELDDQTSSSLKFTGLVDGGIYFVRVRAISEEAPRRMSPEYILRCVASETII